MRLKQLCVAVAVVLMVGCATATGDFGGLSVGSAEVGRPPRSGGGFAADAGQARAAGAPSAAPAPRADQGATALAAAPPASATDAAAPQPVARLRVYSAHLGLVVDIVATAKAAVIDLAEAAGGYVEAAVGATVTVRVPAADFDRVLEQLAALGRVRNRSVLTSDVTDQVSDIRGRLALAEGTRTRLFELLERTTDAAERVLILREIRRLSEQIEQLRGAERSLREQVSRSRITVQLIPRLQQDVEARGTIPFPWIARLDPLTPTVAAAAERWALQPGDGYAVFGHAGAGSVPLRAESAEGTRIRLGATANDPRGDGAFWRRALSHHLTPLYAAAEPFEAGRFQGLTLRSRDQEPFYYLVAVAVDGEQLVVAEAFFPHADALARRQAALLGTLAAAGGGSAQ